MSFMWERNTPESVSHALGMLAPHGHVEMAVAKPFLCGSGYVVKLMSVAE